MARITKKSQQAEATTTKVGRVSKAKAASGQQAPAKATKAPRKGTKASGQQAPAKAPRKAKATTSGQQATRQRYAGRKIKLLVKPDAVNLRGGRAVRWQLVAKARTTDDVLGAQYQLEGEAEPRVFNASNLHPFIDKGYIEIE